MRTTAAENFLIPNATIFVEFAIFVVVLLILWRAVLPPLLRAMDERQETIRRQLAEGQAAAERAEQAEQEYRAALAETRAESTRIREEARARGQQMLTEVKDKAAQEYEHMSAENDARLALERQEILAALQPEIAQMAAELSARIVGEPLPEMAGGADRDRSSSAAASSGLPAGNREGH